jgi:hypothetical protein
MVVTPTATPGNVVTLAAILATATCQVTTTGTAVPLPRNVATPTPPFVITNMPTPANEATAAWLRTVATAQAFVYGTPTPLPTYAITATPQPTAPLLEYLDQMTPAPTVTPTPTPTPTPTAIPELLRGKIAFLSDRFSGQDATVLVMNPDGTELARLNNRWPYYRALELDAMSPDREYRAVVHVRRQGHPSGTRVDDPQIWIETLADGTMSYLTGLLGGADYEPSWSPDGVHIAYVAQQDLNDDIWVIRRDGSEKRRLTANSWEWDKHPSWSPDGNQIVFWSNREASRKQIWIMNADGSDQRRLLESDFNDWNPVWIK